MTHADKRTPHTDALDTLGMIIDNTQKRDAIHLGVEPIVAGEKLKPGMHVAILDGEAFQYADNHVRAMKAVGIVDPFLEQPVKAGEMFWLVVYPRKITSLRHVWIHPDFPVGELDNEPSARDVISAREASEKWIRTFVQESGSQGYYELMAKAEEFCDGNAYGWSDDYLHFQDQDAHGEIPAEFWLHFEVVTGKKPTGKAPEYFSCSC